MNGPVLLLTKNDHWSDHAAQIASVLFPNDLIRERGQVGDKVPESFSLPSYRLILSFLSPWIVSEALLNKSPLSLNFHPGSCDYPGIGCYNFALYEEAAQFGAVCHHMLPQVDSGVVVSETLFPVLLQDRVETLKLRTMVGMLSMFHDVLSLLATGKTLPVNTRQWSRKAFTRKQLDALCEITSEMDKREEKRRVRAMTYPGYPGPYRLEGGQKHFYPVPPGPPLA